MSTQDGPKKALQLDPGTVKRCRASGCTCLLLLGGSLLSLLIALGVARFASVLYQNSQAPHDFMYAKDTSPEDVDNMSSVKFDIVATVWVANRTRASSAAGGDWSGVALAKPVNEYRSFSDVVFRGVTLRDEHVHAQVNLTIPLEPL
ncbi:hypothetical protein DFP72DRAFT_1171849 [Ephemerocybe angulata]|uniref:Uncharacterized protein n=1 Tax=Ephemerocybe angulata TaxID=980116 RepID=A0A8H6HRT6_9AGAR|nr:hypothetical protein DFP72DRAFT_1171849 [Tulosesus angulatus]